MYAQRYGILHKHTGIIRCTINKFTINSISKALIVMVEE